ncbi:hypothetical protein [Actinophytocola sp.]|uniref:hypothetical protein n=1 Tax=Actinophytocola sp. TaxID=1872138 RepID=UPI002ED9F508
MGLVIAAAVVVIVRLPGSPPDHGGAFSVTDPLATVEDFAAALRPDAAYRPPEPDESRALVDAVTRLGRQGSAASTAAAEPGPPGFRTATGVDPSTGRPFAILASVPNDERGWGLYLVDLSTAPSISVQVPHPRADLHTESVGVALFRRLPGAVLMVAGTHRRVANGAGDVAHRKDSMFHALAEEQSRRGMPQIQLHGFDDTSLPDADVIVSAGAGRHGKEHTEIVDRLEASGLQVCAAWRARCGQLEGRRNRQGITAAKEDATFVHVEISRTVRDGADRWGRLVAALAETDFRSRE